MNGHELRRLIGAEEFDYQTLMACLKTFKAPDQKVNELLKTQVVIRIKKGLYIFGPQYSHEAFSKKLLANWIYGPSYISLNSALSIYGLIPERVDLVTSVTCKRDKSFATPVGDFSYRYLNMNKYPLGVTRALIDQERQVFVASIEKALVDLLTLTQDPIHSSRELKELLFEDLRIDKDELSQKVDLVHLRKVARSYNHSSIKLLVTYFESRGGSSFG